MDKFNQLHDIVNAVKSDVTKFDEGNKAAGTRVRKAMQDIKNICGEIRKDVLDIVKSA